MTPVPLPSVVPSSGPAVVVPVPSSAPAPVKPSGPAGSGVPSAPYPVTSGGAVYTNGTVLPTGVPTSAPAGGKTSTGSPQPTGAPANGAATTTFVSMGALFAGLFAFLA